tara:strand:- start:5712 stop:7430 length:1719 start_codon:yes stop_codon:yes gene_type:complete
VSSIPIIGNKSPSPADIVSDMGTDALKGLKITFINMPLRESAKPNVAPEGPGILASIVRDYGADPYILDLNAYRVIDGRSVKQKLSNGRHMSYKEAEDLFLTHLEQVGEVDVIAFSGMITTLRWQEQMAKIIKKHLPNCLLVSGNGLATEIKEGLFKWIPELDAVAHSEGDDVILAICKDGKVIKEKGLRRAIDTDSLTPYYKGELDGRPRFVYGGNRPKYLDSLPFAAWDLLENDPYGNNLLEWYINVPIWGTAANNSSATPFTMDRSLSTVSSRGCPYACAFCYRGAQGERNYGMRSAEHVATQAREYVDKYNIDFLGFVDDNFAVDKRRIDLLPQVFKDYGLNISWGTHTRMDEADERAFKMAEAGCVYIGFGAESASEHTLTEMKKGGFILKNGMTPTKVNGKTYDFPTTMVNAVKNCNAANIHANCTWIMAYPGETLEHLKTSVAFITWQQQYMTNGSTPGSNEYTMMFDSVNRAMFTATAYPGTAMFKDLRVRKLLTNNFGISFDANGNPLIDDAFHTYVLELDDATKVLHNEAGIPLNFGAMPMDTFLQAREHIDADQIEKILEM